MTSRFVSAALCACVEERRASAASRCQNQFERQPTWSGFGLTASFSAAC